MFRFWSKCALWIVFSSTLLIIANGCSKGETEIPPIVGETKSMTLIFYMVGSDNTLSAESFGKIRAIANINLEELTNDNSNIFIYHNPIPAHGIPALYQVVYSKKSTGKDNLPLDKMPTLKQIERYSEENAASKGVFMRVLERCVDLAPAKEYGLWVFSHGSGWMPSKKASGLPVRTPSRAIINDDRDYLQLSEFAESIPDNLFDFIVFESCLSAGVEVAYELRNKTKYIVASSAEVLSPGYLTLYKDVIRPYFNKDVTTLNALIATANRLYIERNSDPNPNQAYQSATLSVINTSHIEELAAVVKPIFQQHGSTIDDISTMQRLSVTLAYEYIFFDLVRYLSELATAEQMIEVERVMAQIMEYKMATPWFFKGINDSSAKGFKVDHHSGLTTYIRQEYLATLNEAHKELQWSKAVGY